MALPSPPRKARGSVREVAFDLMTGCDYRGAEDIVRYYFPHNWHNLPEIWQTLVLDRRIRTPRGPKPSLF